MRLPPIPSDEPAWRCIRSKPKSEHLAARHLKVAGWEAYCPQLRYQKRTTRGPVWFVEALFPGYVFASYPVDAARHVRSIMYVSGLLDFVPELGRIPSDTIHDLQIHFPDSQPHTVVICPSVGDEVQMTAGPMMGMPATITKLLPGSDRIQILIDFLGSPRQMEVSLGSLLGLTNVRATAFGNSG